MALVHFTPQKMKFSINDFFIIITLLLIRQSLQKKLDLQKVIKAEIVNIFFSNTFKNLRIPQREEVDPFADKLSHLILKLIFKYSKNVKFVALNNAGSG